jgi:hypothetical protein
LISVKFVDLQVIVITFSSGLYFIHFEEDKGVEEEIAREKPSLSFSV